MPRHVHENRDDGFRLEIGIERAPPPDAIADQHQHGDDALEIDIAGDVAPLCARMQQCEQPLAHVGIERGRDARDLGMAAGLRHHLRAQQHLLARVFCEVMPCQALQHGKEALGKVDAGELPRHLGAVALCDAGDQRLLRGEIAIEVAGAHAGLGADLLHRRAMEARAHETALRSGQDLVAAVGLKLGVGPAHDGGPPSPCCVATTNSKKRMNVRSHKLSKVGPAGRPKGEG